MVCEVCEVWGGDASESGEEQLCVLVEYHKARSSLISQSMRGMRSMRSMRGARVLCLIKILQSMRGMRSMRSM